MIHLLERSAVSYFAVGLSLILMVTWKTFTVPRFAYWGYEWLPNRTGMGFALALVALLAWFLPTRLRQPGDIALYVMFYVMYVPAVSIPSISLRVPTGDLLALQLMLSVCFIILIAANTFPKVRVDFGLFSGRTYSWFLLVVFIALFLPVVAFVGIPTSIPTFANVYAARAQATASLVAAPFFVAYFWGFLMSVVNPFLVAYGMVTRNWIHIGAGSLGIIYIYAMSGAKSVLFSLLLILVVMAGMRILGSMIVLFFGPGLWLMALFSKFVDQLIPVPWATTLLVDRALVTPGVLTGRYFGYFSTHAKVHWSHTFLSPFFDSANAVDPSITIGTTYYYENTQANTHMLADGFANFGFVGMLFVAIIAGVILWIYNSLSIGRSPYLIMPVATTSAYTLASTSVFTTLLTHGVFLMLILVALSPMDESHQNQTRKSADDVLD